MSALFLLTVVATKQQVLVRARCLSCAREQAVMAAGGEGTMVWRDPNLSTVELVNGVGKTGVIMRGALV